MPEPLSWACESGPEFRVTPEASCKEASSRGSGWVFNQGGSAVRHRSQSDTLRLLSRAFSLFGEDRQKLRPAPSLSIFTGLMKQAVS